MTIVIHPTDISTEFLMPIYGNIPKEELTVVKGGVSKNELIALIVKSLRTSLPLIPARS